MDDQPVNNNQINPANGDKNDPQTTINQTLKPAASKPPSPPNPSDQPKTTPPAPDPGAPVPPPPPPIKPEDPDIQRPGRITVSDKTKKNVKIGGAILGIFLLLGGLVGGRYLFQQQRVGEIKTMAGCRCEVEGGDNGCPDGEKEEHIPNSGCDSGWAVCCTEKESSCSAPNCDSGGICYQDGQCGATNPDYPGVVFCCDNGSWVPQEGSEPEEPPPPESGIAETCPCGGYHEGWCDTNSCTDLDCCGTCMDGLVACTTLGRCQPASEECPGGTDCNPSEDCTFSCSSSTPPQVNASCNDDCNVTVRTLDVCRGKLTGYNCQKCSSCSTDGENCDIPCHCCEGKSLTDSCWASCYEKGGGYNPQAGDYPNAPYWDGTYSCRNTQSDAVVDNTTHVYNCTWEDGRDWWECAEGPPETPTPVADFVCLDPMTANPNPPVPGQPVTLTCRGAVLNTTIDYFEFQYRQAGGDWVNLGTAPDADSNNQESLTMDSAPADAWEARCRVCITTGACSQWYEP